MKVIQFTVPVANQGSVVVQEDILPYFYNFLHRHVESQITYILKGKGTLIVGNYSQPFKAGDIYIIGPNQPHMFKGDARYFEEQNEKNIHAIHIFFDIDKLDPLLSLPEFDEVKKFWIKSKGSLMLCPKYTKKASSDILKIYNLNGLNRLFKFAGLIHFFATGTTRWKSMTTGNYEQNYSDLEGMRMNDIFHFTLDHFSQPITLSKIAAVACMTPHAFCKYFKKHTRKTYLCFLNEIRINEACKILLSGKGVSISSIAYATGFNSAIAFNRVFRKVTGKSPSEYIKEYKFEIDNLVLSS